MDKTRYGSSSVGQRCNSADDGASGVHHSVSSSFAYKPKEPTSVVKASNAAVSSNVTATANEAFLTVRPPSKFSDQTTDLSNRTNSHLLSQSSDREPTEKTEECVVTTTSVVNISSRKVQENKSANGSEDSPNNITTSGVRSTRQLTSGGAVTCSYSEMVQSIDTLLADLQCASSNSTPTPTPIPTTTTSSCSGSYNNNNNNNNNNNSSNSHQIYSQPLVTAGRRSNEREKQVGSPTANNSRCVYSPLIPEPFRASSSSCERQQFPNKSQASFHDLNTGMDGNKGAMSLDELLRDLNLSRNAHPPAPDISRSKSPTLPPPEQFSSENFHSDSLDHGYNGENIYEEPCDDLYETRTVTVTESVPGKTPPSAASADDELQKLMNSLPQFKILSTSSNRTVIEEATPSDPVYAVPNKPPPIPADQLDSMFGTLQQDMSSQGASLGQKGICAACQQPIVGQDLTAMNRKWHVEHFTCAECGVSLANSSFFERDERPYCEPDFHRLFSPKCAGCNGPILDRFVTALQRTWHPEHLCCSHCGDVIDCSGGGGGGGGGGFYERNGKAYCRRDYMELFAVRCNGCGNPVIDNYLSALDGHWHPACFVCTDCHQSFENGAYYIYEDSPYCSLHFHSRKGSLCAGCNQPVEGQCVTAMYRKYHPEHFVCSFCLKQLNSGTFKEHAKKPYCHPCHNKLF